MFVPLVDLKGQYQKIESEISDAISYVFENSNFILGESVGKFEEDFCQYLDGGYAVGVNSGTDALYLSLLASEINPGDEVITVAHTFIATYLAIVQTGAKPVLIDIDLSTFNMDPNKIEEKITDKTKAIIPVHLYGYPAKMDQIMEIAKKYDLVVIEDACQAHGSQINGRKTGLFGDFACFSFYPTKNLGAYGDGGAVVTQDEIFREKLLSLRNYGQKKKYFHDRFGINTRLDELQAAVLRVKLNYLDEWNTARRKIAKQYHEQINSPYVSCPVELDGYFHVYHLFVIKTSHRNQLQRWLEKKNIQTQIHYPRPVHLQNCFLRESQNAIHLPVTESISKKILSLPMYPEMSIDQVEYIVKSINEFNV